MQKTVVLAGIFILVAGAAQADTSHWNHGGSGNTEWTNAVRWTDGMLPGTEQQDNAVLSGSDTVTVNSEVTSTYGVDLSVRNATVDTSLTIAADMSSLNKIDISTAGNATDNKVVQNAGTVTVSGNVTAGGVAEGTGVYEQTGGR
ncbi:hypothetical protein P4E94_02590 [Pontiellaceae bacterium B12219]|nr:hypothetical protein [Pontiellaceae bacterium B12219]